MCERSLYSYQYSPIRPAGAGPSVDGRDGAGLESSLRYLTTVRYGAMHYTARFHANFTGVKFGDTVIVRTERGVEVGNVVSIPRQDEHDGEQTSGEVLRVATEDDREKLRRIEEEEEPLALKLCQGKIEEHKLPMKLARAEKLFGGHKAVFYFLSDGRVDFRELVKDLATEYQTRIQMVQIGVRDEARLLADYEHCGRELCCRTFIKKLEPVSMKMAKSQKATLDPAKISGRCGRLMCCLRFEDGMYEELKRSLPKKGTRVRLKDGTGDVVSFDVLQQTVRVELDESRRIVTAHVAEIEERLGRERPSQGRGGPPAEADRPKQEPQPTPQPKPDAPKKDEAPAAQKEAAPEAAGDSSKTKGAPSGRRGRRSGGGRRGRRPPRRRGQGQG